MSGIADPRLVSVFMPECDATARLARSARLMLHYGWHALWKRAG